MKRTGREVRSDGSGSIRGTAGVSLAPCAACDARRSMDRAHASASGITSHVDAAGREANLGFGAAASRGFVLTLTALYALLWILLAIEPFDRSDWALENLLVAVVIPTVAILHRRLSLSRISFALIAVFMVLHAFGAHYTYAQVPLGDAMKDSFDLSRNHFDRLVHGAFGLLLYFPLRESYVRGLGLRGAASWYFPAMSLLAWSGCYEVLESWVALIVSPELGAQFLGSQGDEWDAQKDMTCALVGVLVAFGIERAIRAARGR